MTDTHSTYRTLRRSRTDRVLGGVCGGFARYLNIDPTLARVLYILATLMTGGAFVIAYAIFWLVMPQEPTAAPWPGDPTAHPSV